MKFVDYKILSAPLEYDLEPKVKNLLKLGWIPCGGPCLAKTRVLQAVALPEGVQNEKPQEFS